MQSTAGHTPRFSRKGALCAVLLLGSLAHLVFGLCGTLCYFVILKCSFIQYGTDLGIHTTWIPNIWPLLINDLGAPKRQRKCLLFLLNEINRFCPVFCQHILDHFGYIFFCIFVVSHFHHFPCGGLRQDRRGANALQRWRCRFSRCDLAEKRTFWGCSREFQHHL